nr:heavy metal sensor histidine kinase [Enterovibrio paralichthyis]
MKNRLILMFMAFSVLVYLFVASIIETSLKYHFYDQDYQHTKDKYDAISWGEVLREPPENLVGRINTTVDYWVLKNNHVVATNSGIPLQAGMPETLLSAFQSGKQLDEWEDEQGLYRPFLFDAGDQFYVLMVQKIDGHLQFFKQLRVVLLWSALLVVLLAIAFSIVAVNLGLKPLKHVQNHLKTVNPNNLDVVIPTDNLPDELRDLVTIQNDMLKKLNLGFSRLSEFSSDIAHELKTPLSNINTQTQVTLASTRSVEEYQDVLQSNLEEIERITKTIDDILYIAKAKNALLIRTNTKFAVETEIDRIADYFSILGEEKGIDIITRGHAFLSVDKNMLERAVTNLLTNALSHADHASNITIEVLNLPNEVCILVENQGDTIPEASLPYLFDRFYRVDKSRKHESSVGSGLGLAITQSIMEAYDGSVSVESKHRRTVFTLTFPK